MIISGVRPIKPRESAQNKRKTTNSANVFEVDAGEQIEHTPEIAKFIPMQSTLFVLQDMLSQNDEREEKKRSEDTILTMLEQYKNCILNQRVDAQYLHSILDIARATGENTHNEVLLNIINEVALLAAVELAKISRKL